MTVLAAAVRAVSGPAALSLAPCPTLRFAPPCGPVALAPEALAARCFRSCAQSWRQRAACRSKSDISSCTGQLRIHLLSTTCMCVFFNGGAGGLLEWHTAGTCLGTPRHTRHHCVLPSRASSGPAIRCVLRWRCPQRRLSSFVLPPEQPQTDMHMCACIASARPPSYGPFCSMPAAAFPAAAVWCRACTLAKHCTLAVCVAPPCAWPSSQRHP
jgi:hypothetical protein